MLQKDILKLQKLAVRQKTFRKIIKKNKCENCGSSENLEFHHKDYGDYEAVATLCKECHYKIHGKIYGSESIAVRIRATSLEKLKKAKEIYKKSKHTSIEPSNVQMLGECVDFYIRTEKLL